MSRPNEVWVSDITYVRLGNAFVYLAVIMDVFTRSLRGCFLSRRPDGNLTLIALKRAPETHTPEIHHSDQGGQYAQQTMSHCSKAEVPGFRSRRSAVLRGMALRSG
ncbi:MAG: DDE-type integrase/transposase/recombinase [Armatimonadota bacterium]